MKKILIPIDGSDHSRRAMEKGKEFALAFGSKITLLHIQNLFIPYLSYEESIQFINMINTKSQEILDDGKKSLSDFEDVELVSLEGDVASTLIEYIADNNFDLIIMGSQGLNAGKLQGLFLGSVTNKVIHNTKKPVLIVR